MAGPGLVEALASKFPVGAARAAMVHVEREWSGHVWALETESGRIVFTELFDKVAADAMEVQTGLVERVVPAGVLTPIPIRSVEGTFVVRIADRSWRAHRWMQLGQRPPVPVPRAVAAEAGRILARIRTSAPSSPRAGTRPSASGSQGQTD